MNLDLLAPEVVEEKLDLSVAELLRRERQKKRELVEAEEARLVRAREKEDAARQLAVQREAEEALREEERAAQREIERQEALVREVEENERKTKTYFDISQHDRHKPTFHHLVKATTGGQYFGDYEVLGKDPEELEKDAIKRFCADKDCKEYELTKLEEEEMHIWVKKQVGKQRQMLRAIRPFIDWRAHGWGKFRANSGEVVYKGQYVRGQRHGRGTWTFADGASWQGHFFKDDAKGLGTYRWTEDVTELDADGAYVVVDRKIQERDAFYHANTRRAFADELKTGCRLTLLDGTATVVGRPTRALVKALKEAEERVVKSRHGKLFATTEERDAYADRAESQVLEARAALRNETRYNLHFDLSNIEREVDLADVAFSLDGHKPLVHHFARKEHLHLKRYDRIDQELVKPTPAQALQKFRQGMPSRSRPSTRESTASTLQLQLSPEQPKTSTMMTLHNSHRRHHLLQALTLDEGKQSDHRENFYEFKEKPKSPPKKIVMDGESRKAYLQAQADKQRAVIEAQRAAALGEAMEGQAAIDATSAQDEADLEAEMEVKIILMKEERAAWMAQVRAGTVTETQEAFLEGPWRDAAEQQRMSRIYVREMEMTRKDRKVRGLYVPGTHSYENATLPMPVRAARSERAAPLVYTAPIAIKRDDDTWVHDYDINKRARDAKRAVERIWDAKRRAWEQAERKRLDQEQYIKHCLGRAETYKRELLEAEAARARQEEEEARVEAAEAARPESRGRPVSRASATRSQSPKRPWSRGNTPKTATRKEKSAYWRKRKRAEPDGRPASRDLCKITARRNHVPLEPTELGLEAGECVIVLKGELSDEPGWVFATKGEDAGYVPRNFLLRKREDSPTTRRSWLGSRGSARARSPEKPKKKRGGFFSWLSKAEPAPDVPSVTPVKKPKKVRKPMTLGEMRIAERERIERKKRKKKFRLRKIPGFDA